MHAENLAQRSDAELLYVVDTKPEAARALKVFGQKGMLRAANVTPTTVEHFGAEASCAENPWPNFQTRYASAYAAELTSFISSVQRGKPAEVPPEDSRQGAPPLRRRAQVKRDPPARPTQELVAPRPGP